MNNNEFNAYSDFLFSFNIFASGLGQGQEEQEQIMSQIEYNKNIDIRPSGNRWIAHLCGILFFQCFLYSGIAVSFYAIVTLNWGLVLLLLAFAWVQSFIRQSKTYIKFVNHYIRPLNYFKRFQRIYDQPEFKEKYTLFCLHPHGVFGFFFAANMHADNSRMSQMVSLGSRFILACPIFGAILRLWGIRDVDPSHMKKVMRDHKHHLGLIPGGYEEATITSSQKFKIFIKHRKGFIKYAIKYGYTIRPVIVYNEHKAFKTVESFQKTRLLLNKVKMPGVFFYGGFLAFFLPLDLELVTIVGRGISRKPQNEGKFVTQEQIDDMHERYIEEIQRLHSKYKDEFKQGELMVY